MAKKWLYQLYKDMADLTRPKCGECDDWVNSLDYGRVSSPLSPEVRALNLKKVHDLPLLFLQRRNVRSR